MYWGWNQGTAHRVAGTYCESRESWSFLSRESSKLASKFSLKSCLDAHKLSRFEIIKYFTLKALPEKAAFQMTKEPASFGTGSSVCWEKPQKKDAKGGSGGNPSNRRKPVTFPVSSLTGSLSLKSG